MLCCRVCPRPEFLHQPTGGGSAPSFRRADRPKILYSGRESLSAASRLSRDPNGYLMVAPRPTTT